MSKFKNDIRLAIGVIGALGILACFNTCQKKPDDRKAYASCSSAVDIGTLGYRESATEGFLGCMCVIPGVNGWKCRPAKPIK